MADTGITLHSDGFGGVAVTGNGEKLNGVASATIWLEANEPTRVDLEFRGVAVNIQGKVDEVKMVCPICSHSTGHKCSETL